MNRLEELIEELCPEGVEYRNLGDICNILDSQRKPVTKKDRSEGEYPYYGANGIQDYVREYIFDGTFLLVGEDGSVINKDKSPVLSWAVGKIWVNNHAHVLSEKRGVLLRYIFHYMQTINVSSIVRGTPPKLNQQNLRKIKIAVPPVEIQREIVRILDSFTELTAELIAELTAELTARKKQYEYYRDGLFLPKAYEFKKMKLNSIAQIYDGTHQTPKYTDSGIKFISVENIKDIYNSSKYISVEDFKKYKIKPQINDVFMTRIGSIGKCAVFDKEADIAYYVSLALIRPNASIINSRYLKYVIESGTGQKELRKRTLINAVPIKINKDDIGKIELPIPSLQVQEQIVNILDKFDKLCNDISEGIQAEIEARKKQYEYYRDKLLTFKKLEE